MPPSQLARHLRFQEAGLIGVILALGLFLTLFGGTVREPVFETAADGSRHQAQVVLADGTSGPRFVEHSKFLRPSSLVQLAKTASFVAIMAVGMTLVIVTGGIDLSVGSLYALCSVLGALVLHAGGSPGGGLPPGLAGILGVGLCVAVGCLAGAFNAGLMVGLRVHPFIITLGMMAILRGCAFVITRGQSIGDFPASFRDPLMLRLGGLEFVPILLTGVVLAAGWLILSRLAIGRRIYAVGGNETAARFSGVPVERTKILVYAFGGLCVGIAAVLNLGLYGAASSGDGQGYELNVIAASVVGGASLSGGRGTALGAILGALLIQMIDNGITTLGIDQSWSQIVIGAAVIIAVVLDRISGGTAARA